MFEGVGKDTIELARQALLGCLDRAKEIITELRDESEIHIELPQPIRVFFKRKSKEQDNANSAQSESGS